MNIGAEISKKIQLAITAKLKDLDAFIDEELPDYIMIMVANKKTREQMAEALGLFLGENTDKFTDWLHNLLDTLRKASNEYKEEKSQEITETDDKKETEMKDATKSESTKKEKIIKSESQSSIKAEDALIIEPEGQELMEDELFLNSIETSVDKNESEEQPAETQSTISPPETMSKDSKKKIEPITFPEEKSSKSSKEKKQKSKKEKRSRDVRKKSSDSKKHNSSTTKSSDKKNDHSREWDKGKGETNERKRSSGRHRTSTDNLSDNERESLRRKSSITSAVSVVKNSENRTHSYVSESESDGELNTAAVVSKVAFPPRKPKLPADKQANRKLLLRAVVEAEKSVKTRRGQLKQLQEKPKSKPLLKRRRPKSSDSYEEEYISSRERKRLSHGDEIHSTGGNRDLRESKLNRDRRSHEDLRKRKNVRADEDNINNTKVKRKLPSPPTTQSDDDDDAPLEYITLNVDQRKFVSKSQDEEDEVSSPKSKPKTVKRNKMPTAVQFDSRRAAKTAAGANRDVVAKTDPKFIVTLDGIVTNKNRTATISSKKKTTINKTQVEEPEKKPFKFTPIFAPEMSPPARTASPPAPVQKPVVFDTGDDDEYHDLGSTEAEIQKMKLRLLAMERDAAKFKDLQKSAELSAASLQVQKPNASLNNKFSDKNEIEKRSISISNVHFITTEKQLAEHFSICGKISRVTILRDPYTGHPKGFAYIEFEEEQSATASLIFDNKEFNNRTIRVMMKQSKPTNPSPHVYIARPRTPQTAPVFRFPPQAAYPAPPRYSTPPRFPAASPRFQTRNKVWVKPGYKPPTASTLL